MAVFCEPSRKVYVHPAEELSVKAEELKFKVAFKGVPVEITKTVDLIEWLKKTHDAVDVLSSGGWMEIPSQQAAASLPTEFTLHVRRKPLLPPTSAGLQRSKEESGFLDDIKRTLELHTYLLNYSLIHQNSNTNSYGSSRSRNSERDSSFKNSLVEISMGSKQPTEMIECSITKLKLPSHEVVAGHIFPRSENSDLQLICPKLHHVDDPRNGILWAYCIEEAFEASCIACKWNEETHILRFYVLDKNLLNKNLYQANMYVKSLKGRLSPQEASSSLSVTQDTNETDLASSAIQDKKKIETELENAVSSKIEQLAGEGVHGGKMREYLINVSKPYVCQLYSSISFNSLQLKDIQLDKRVSMDEDAWQFSAVLKVHNALGRKVLPKDFPLSELVPEDFNLQEPPIMSFFKMRIGGLQVNLDILEYFYYNNPHYKVNTWLNSSFGDEYSGEARNDPGEPSNNNAEYKRHVSYCRSGVSSS